MEARDKIFYPVLDEKLLARINDFYAQEDVQAAKVETNNFVGACQNMSFIVSHITGFKLEGGKFRVDTPFKNGLMEGAHWWCKDGLGRIIDLTAVQYNNFLSKPVEDGVLVVNPDDPFYRRYTAGITTETKIGPGKVVHSLITD